MKHQASLENFILQYNSYFSDNEFFPIQKIYTSPHFLVFQIRFPGKTRFFYVGRGGSYSGFGIAEDPIPSFLRLKDKALDYFRKFFIGVKLGKLESKQGVLFIKIKSEGKLFNWCLGFNEHKLFFAHDLEGKFKSTNDLIVNFDSLENVKMKSDTMDIFDIEKYIKAQSEISSGNIFISKRKKFLEKKIKNIKSDIESAKSWVQIKDIIDNENIDMNLKEFSYGEVKIKFRNENEFQRRDLVYQKIKKLKKAEKLLVQRLDETEQELDTLNNGKLQIQTTKEKPIQIHWFDDVKRIKSINKLNLSSQNKNIKNLKLENIDGLIGLNAEGNDYIRKNLSKDFLWFHLEGYPGAHCVLKISNVEQLAPEKFAAIGSMLRDLSDLKMIEIQLVYSHLKNIAGVKGRKGQVIVKKPRYLKVIYQEWKEIISVN